MDQPKIERVLRLMTILTSNVSYTVQDIAQMMGTSSRSIYRYMDTLKGAGFVIERVDGTIYRCAALKRLRKQLGVLGSPTCIKLDNGQA